ncbi:ABC transporter ATP-binding protein [Dactylosporangium sp. AC04546]|uniref:ABC transporter ATP-binding protein n=1 Tax=Dactylosporangium sp. AC04546 TaxID=2862460 RepID=UPI001EDD0FAA|nr:ABC transporter ATP-binding protein [Dactylosporangium sp. AC04546]WVK81673.1 ABC transporter ATP-binding protein [Dactylosporangium sp. AC04546]
MADERAAVGLRSLLPYLRDHRGTLVVVGVLSLAGSVTTLAQPLLTRQVLDGLQASRAVGGTVAVLVAVLAGVALLNALRDFLLQRTAEGLVLTARRRLTRHLLRLPISEYDRRRTGDLLSRVGADSTLLRAVVTAGLFETVTGVVMVAGAAVAMVLLDPVLFLTAGAGLALGLSIALVFARRVRPASEAAQARIGEMTSAVERALTAARTIRASNAEAREIAAVDVSATEAYRAGVRIAKLEALVGPASLAAIQGAFLLLLGVGGARVAAGTISVGDLVAFVLYLFFLVMPLGQAIHAYTQLQTGLGALQRMEDVLAVPLEADDGTRTPVPGPVAVAFDRVTFGYGTGEPVVRDVSFTVPFGTRTALVGPSGAGKSTLLQLVERFYDVTGGAVQVAGVDVRELPRTALRGMLGYVEQEAPVLAGTLRENLRLTVPDATDAQMLAVLDAVNLADIVGRTPEGLDAQVGEGGVLLSGGERQRLAIARTLLAAPPILLLDEPTSNLDARNEVALRQAIDTVARNRTMIVVAHRLSTVVDADQIVVMEGGRVVATGRHEELTETNELYRELATNQLLVA